MAKQTLPVNYQDDIVSESMNGRRRYNMIQNPDGTVSLVDATEYDLVGTNFGAGQINAITQAINDSADATKIVESPEDCESVTEDGFIASAKALGQVNRNFEALGGFMPVIDSTTGKITGYKTEVGADTVFPFSSYPNLEIGFYANASGSSATGAYIGLKTNEPISVYNDSANTTRVYGIKDGVATLIETLPQILSTNPITKDYSSYDYDYIRFNPLTTSTYQPRVFITGKCAIVEMIGAHTRTSFNLI